MKATEILNEILKDPIFKEKYGMSELDIENVSFDTTSSFKIIEIIKTVIQYEIDNIGNNVTYNQIKARIIGIRD